MKKAFFLMEVMVSILLVFGSILILFEVESNNLNFLERLKKNNDRYSAISIFALNDYDSLSKNNDQKLYFDEVVTFEDDELRKRFKNLTVNAKYLDSSSKSMGDDLKLTVLKKEINYFISKQLSQKIYRFELRSSN